MKCPKCGKQCEKGFIEARDAGSITQWSTIVNWYPESSKGKMIKRGAISVDINAEGYYCDECMSVFAVFMQK